MDAAFEYVFPAIRGVQARREHYVSMCPLRLIPKIFLFDEDEMVPEIRAQRTLNRGRLPEIAQYILDNRDDYVFSALTASVDGDVRFEQMGSGPDGKRVGQLHIPMSAQFIINDGQHRRAAIELALRENPDLADESISVVFFIDQGLERCQQMFADLNRHAIRPSKSIGVLYDNRDERARLVKMMVLRSPLFRDVVELERTTLSKRSRKIFTLSAIYSATSALLHGISAESLEDQASIAATFWEEVAKQIPEWKAARDGKISAGEVRSGFIHTHSVVLLALGQSGNQLLGSSKNDSDWKRRIKKLKNIDWSRGNAKLWEGRALVGGRVTKSGQNVALTANVIKHQLGLSLSPEEDELERAFTKGSNGSP
jgi:DNA sulfur modification protein DndB